MRYLDKIIGKYIILRCVEIEDAAFVLELRTDESKNKFIHSTENNLEKQQEWIRRQLDEKNDYYFVFEDKDENPIGLASIYNINQIQKEAEFGRWISKGNALQNLESAILLHDFAFGELGLNEVYTRTMSTNKKVRGFWKRFGGNNVGDIEVDGIILNKNIIDKENYEKVIREKNNRLLYI